MKSLLLLEYCDPWEFHGKILKMYPKLHDGGGYKLLRTPDSLREQNVITLPSCGYTTTNVKSIVNQAKVYIRSLQKDLSLEETMAAEEPANTECVITMISACVTFTQNITTNLSTLFTGSSPFLPAGARERLVLRLIYVFRVCLFVCLSVWVSALITCAIYYVIRYYATAVYSSFWRFASQATAIEGSFVLPRWQKRGK